MSDRLPTSRRESTLAWMTANEPAEAVEYGEATFEEEDELRLRLASFERYGYSDDGRRAVRRAGRVLMVLAGIALAFLIGRATR